MSLDALIFDLDGTLVDTNATHVEAFRLAFADRGYKVAPDLIATQMGKGGDGLVPALIGKEGDDRDGDALREAQPKHFDAIAGKTKLRVFPGAVELVKEARRRGLKTALATSSGKGQIKVTSRHSGVDWPSLFDEIVLADDVRSSKPAPDVVSVAAKKLGLSAAQTAMVGDTPYDARACRDSGSVCLGVLSGGFDESTLRHAGARRVWRDAAHLLAELDDALHAASPGPAKFNPDFLDRLMRRALAAAERGLAAGEAPIGCVLARGDGTVVAEGYNELNATHDRTAHAEMVAFRAAAALCPDRVPPDADDLVLVSTLEPCVMCLGAAMESAVDTVVYGMKAPADSGTRRMAPPQSAEAKMPRVVGDVRAGEARTLFERFLARPGVNPKQAEYVKQLLAST